MQYVYNDGGRTAAGYTGKTGDCVCRAIAIVTGQAYTDVYACLNVHAERERPRGKARRSHSRTGVHKRTYHRYLTELGYLWVPTMGIGTGCTVHLNAAELPTGRLIVSVSRHLTAVIDHVIHDTHDPQDRGTTIYPAGYLGNIPAKAVWLENGNGYAYTPERCVYGYYHKP